VSAFGVGAAVVGLTLFYFFILAPILVEVEKLAAALSAI
jgi:hypothetical protein